MENSPYRIYFDWYDYVLFGSMLLVSIAIGIYFSFIGRNERNITNEYFLGGKKMFVGPIAVSLVASHISSVTLLSVPSHVYTFGAMYVLSTISILVVAVVTSYVYLPVFFELQLNSIYEYLNLRFNASVRTFCSFLFILNSVLYMSIVVYVPALAYSQATGMSVYSVIPVICAVCTFYTAIGGVKAVVWTDTLQFTITTGALAIVIYLGLVRTGGLWKVLATARNGDRLAFNFHFNLTTHETVFAVLMHWYLVYMRMSAASQECVLKFLALPTLKKAQRSVFLLCLGLIVMKFVAVLMGLIIYASYHDCDPVAAGLIAKHDQIVPFHVADIAAGVPGLTGLFISGVFCTGLSTLSSTLNALSATLYQDFIVNFLPGLDASGWTSFTIKFLVVIVGVFIAALATLVDHLGPILPLAIGVSSITAGSLIGLFTLGMLCPRVNAKGALWGASASILTVGWLFVGAQWHQGKGFVHTVPKHFSTEECTFEIPLANRTVLEAPESSVFYLYRISRYYYALIGTVICIGVAFLVSYATRSEVEVRRELLSSLVHFIVESYEAQHLDVSVDRKLGSQVYRPVGAAGETIRFAEDTGTAMSVFRNNRPAAGSKHVQNDSCC